MKKLINSIAAILLFAGYAAAQQAPAMFAVYEDNVMPSMNTAFRDGQKKLKALCEQNKVDLRWTTLSYDDNSYTHLVPMKSFADMDKNPFAPVEAKIGKDAMAAVWTEMDKCIASKDSYVVLRMDSHSYLSPPAGENFRDILFWFPSPGKEGEAEGLIMEWKKLNELKKTENGFVTYKVIFGRDPGYAFVFWGKDDADAAAKSKKGAELNGEDGDKLWAKTMLITKRRYSKRGWVSTELSYAPPAVAAPK